MPKMTDSRRKRIQAKQRKLLNEQRRAAKLEKREQRAAKTGAKPGTAAS
jgi:hypothetical protein